MKFLSLQEIKNLLPKVDVFTAIEQAFVDYSAGLSVVPPVGELLFKDPPGDVHIKYGYIKDTEFYVVKIASGFYNNAKFNLPSSNGLMLLFNQKTGEPVCALLDEGYLTDIRTAVAGAIAAKYLAPKHIHCIGIVGTGTQAKLQLAYLKNSCSCKKVIVWGRNLDALEQYKSIMTNHGYDITTTQHIEELTQQANLIVTTTPATSPLLTAAMIKPGTHITAVGADTPEKQELDEKLFAKADVIVADSLSQCMTRGEIHHAIIKSIIKKEDSIELGNVIAGVVKARTNDTQITIADLTGVAVQDIAIATQIYQAANRL